MANVGLQALQRQGWYLTPEGIEECTEGGKNRVEDLIKVALDSDLKDIGERHLPEGAGKGKAECVDGPFVLQIQKIRNVSAPKEHEESQGAPKLFKLVVSDGHSSCTALEMENIPSLSLNTPPGTKIKLLGKVPVNHGFLLLNNSRCKVLGGHVEKLVENWELKRSLAKHSRSMGNSDGGGPPRFIPFGQRRKAEDTSQYSNKRDIFKSLDSGKEKKEGDKEFEQQRQATIAEALQAKEEAKDKKFGAGNVKQDSGVAKIVEMGFTVEQASSALRLNGGNVQQAIDSLLNKDSYRDGPPGGRGPPRGTPRERGPPGGGDRSERGERFERRDRGDKQEKFERPDRGDRAERGAGRGRRKNMEEEEDFDGSCKPSAPATLFDYLTKKIPSSKDDPKAKKDSSQKGDRTVKGGPEAEKEDTALKRGPANLPPRLIKAQQRREEERQYRDRARGPPPGQTESTSEPQARKGANDKQSFDKGDRQQNTRGQAQRGRNYDQGGRNYDQGQGGRNSDNYKNYDRNYDNSGRNNEGSRSYDQGNRNYQGSRHYEQGDRNYYDQGQHYDDYYSSRGQGGRGKGGGSGQSDHGYGRDQRDSNRKVHDVNNRGSVQNKTLWNDGDEPKQDGRRQDSRNQDQNERYGGRDRGQDWQKGRDNNYNSQNNRQQRGEERDKPIGRREQGQSVRQSSQQTAQQASHVKGGSRSNTNMGNVDHSSSQTRSQHVNGEKGNQAPSSATQPTKYTQAPPQPSLPPQQYHPATAIVQQMQNLHISSSGTGPMSGVYSTGDPQYMQVQAGYPVSSGIPMQQYSSTPAQTLYTTSSMQAANLQNNKQNNNSRHQRSLKPGDACMAKYWEDRQFYRAVIQSASPKGYYVTFSDYGNTEEVSTNDIRPAPKQAWDSSQMQGQQQTVVVSQQLQQANVTMGTPSSLPGVLVQAPPNMPFVSAFPTTQPYQGSVSNMEFTPSGMYYTNQQQSQQKVNRGRPQQQFYVSPNQQAM